jgi:hypothetical protein
MSKYCSRQILLISLVTLLCAGCSYVQHYQQQSHFSHIQNDISLSTLDKVNKYTSRTPFHKIYEFEFKNLHNKPYALIFYMSESSFSKSVIKHRDVNELHRSAIRIDESKNTLNALNINLPNPDSIIWQKVSKQIEKDEARNGYYAMQEYIRLKIRDL